MRSSRRLVAPLCVVAAGSLLGACTNETNPPARAWERSAAYSRAFNPDRTNGMLAATDGAGSSIFLPEEPKPKKIASGSDE